MILQTLQLISIVKKKKTSGLYSDQQDTDLTEKEREISLFILVT